MSENIEMLVKGSLDIRYYKRQLIIGICVLPLMILVVVIGAFSPRPIRAIVPITLLVISYGCLFAYQVYKLKYLSRDQHLYELYEATVLEGHHAFGGERNAMYLDIKLLDGKAEDTILETLGVFTRDMLSHRYYKDYLGETIRVLYDREGGRVLVVNDME